MKIFYSCKMQLGLILVAFCLIKFSLIYLDGSSYTLHSDDVGYVESAKIWYHTGQFTYNDPTRHTLFITPALPAFIMLLIKLTGSEGVLLEQTIRVVQTLMIALSFYLLFVIGRRLLHQRVALLAVAISACYIPLWLASNLILTESLFILALMILIYCFMRCMEKPSAMNAVWFGIAWAAAVYVRPTIALWPGICLLLLIYWRTIPWRMLLKYILVTGLVFALCMLPWWVRNYEVSGGQFIPLTKSSGNPLLLGTFPYHMPSLEVQRTWHSTDDLRVNDEMDTKWALQRIREGFTTQPFIYATWYTLGKFAMFWGDVFYWIPVSGIPLIVPIAMHYGIIICGFIGVWRARHNKKAYILFSLFIYLTLLHMVYFPLSRYALPLMPLMSLFAALYIQQRFKNSKVA